MVRAQGDEFLFAHALIHDAISRRRWCAPLLADRQ
jgi:hypothetical protein